MTIPILQIVITPESQLRNADASPQQIRDLKDSIEDIGLQVPIQVERIDGDWHLVDGNHRLKAYKQLYNQNGAAGSPTNPYAEIEAEEIVFTATAHRSVESLRTSYQLAQNTHAANVSSPNEASDWIDAVVRQVRDPKGVFGSVYLNNNNKAKFQASMDQLETDLHAYLKREITCGPLKAKSKQERIVKEVFEKIGGAPTLRVNRHDKNDIQSLVKSHWPNYLKRLGQHDKTNNRIIYRVTENDYMKTPLHVIPAINQLMGSKPWTIGNMPELIFVASVDGKDHDTIKSKRQKMIETFQEVNQWARDNLVNLQTHKYASLYFAPQLLFDSKSTQKSETALKMAV